LRTFLRYIWHWIGSSGVTMSYNPDMAALSSLLAQLPAEAAPKAVRYVSWLMAVF